MFVKQLAHLYANFNDDNRANKILAAGESLPLPPVSSLKYLLNLLFEIGVSKPSAVGAIPIDWVDIDSYVQLTQTKLLRQETIILRNLSKLYCNQLKLSEKPIPAPWGEGDANKAMRLSLFANHPNYRGID